MTKRSKAGQCDSCPPSKLCLWGHDVARLWSSSSKSIWLCIVTASNDTHTEPDTLSQPMDSNFINCPGVTGRLCFQLLLRHAGMGEQGLGWLLQLGKLNPYWIRKSHLNSVLKAECEALETQHILQDALSIHWGVPWKAQHKNEDTGRIRYVAEREQGKPEMSCALHASQPFPTFSPFSFSRWKVLMFSYQLKPHSKTYA